MGQNLALQVCRTVVGKVISWLPLDDTSGAVLTIGADGPLPKGATAITAASGNVAAGNAVATLAAVAGKTTYITGFTLTASGATTALPVIVTVAGTITGTLSYIFTFPAGVLIAAQPLNVQFPVPIPASAVNTTIVVTLPSGGTGNTNAAAVAAGFQL